MQRQVPVRFVLMRGGTSKAVFLRAADLPREPAARDRVILSIFGSPDPRQIDGLGGADILTSKVAIIGPPGRPDADLDYTFGQVSIREPVVDYDINCGNISAAVGVYAVEEGLVHVREPVTRVRIHNTNTGRVLVAEVPVADGAAQVEGDFAIDGVPGTGARILLDYRETAGGATGSLLPTGHPVDELEVPELGRRVAVSLVDIANLCAFVRADSVGWKGTEGPGELDGGAVAGLMAIKAAAARRVGLPPDGLVPILTVVSPPAAYVSYATGQVVAADDLSLVARVVAGRPATMHKAFPGTASICTAVAARLPGTVPFEVARQKPPDVVTIGHPSGTLPVWVRLRGDGGTWQVEQAAYARTARRLAEGYTFVRRSVWPGA